MCPLLLGHRGLRRSRLARENTLPAFDLALHHGCDGFEFDVRLTADGAAVVCHDARFAEIVVAKASAARLKHLPKLEDVLAQYCERAFLDIELKVPGLAKSLIAALCEFRPKKGYVISSFLPDVLTEVKAVHPLVRLGFICDERRELQLWRELPVEFVIAHQVLVSRELVDELHGAGKKLLVWTVNRKPAMLRFADWKVDGIISDKTEMLVRALRFEVEQPAQ